MPGVPATVASFTNLMEVSYNLQAIHIKGLLKTLEEVIAFGIHICGNVMGDLPGCMASADALIIRCGPHPERATIGINFLRLPEPYMVPFLRVRADFLFKR